MLIGLYVRHIKVYKNITFIPIGSKYNFVTYLGENGVGKSTILESLDCFFNNKNYSINKSALNDGISTKNNEPFVTPVFAIKKDKISRLKKEFEILSDYFWDINIKDLPARTKNITKDFFELRENLINRNCSKESHYLLVIGDGINNKKSYHFGPFQNSILSFFAKKKNNESQQNEEIEEDILKYLPKNLLIELKDIYSYVYIPVELEAKSFTKIETIEMQKIFNKEIKEEIFNALENINLDRARGINQKLNEFIKQIEITLNREYFYDSDNKRNRNLTKNDLVETILEVYFQQRSLYKKDDSKGNKKIEELSAGEKRQALIKLVYAFLKAGGTREKTLIIAIDEPENSLHCSLCYEQFEKLQEISNENQIFITTHWYGHLPIISKGYSHFLEIKEEKITFTTIDLYNYRNEIKENDNFNLKSMNDIVQSIFYSVIQLQPYMWIVCEGISEKIYFEYFFNSEIKNNHLRILAMDGNRNVLRLYKYLYIPVNLELKERSFGKILCLIDTDAQRIDYDAQECNNLLIRRICNLNDCEQTELVSLANNNTEQTDIEQSLNPIIFKETLEELNVDEIYKVQKIKKEDGNTSFINNFRNLDLREYFKMNSGENKVIFAKKYIEILSKKEEPEIFEPKWIKKIKNFLKNGKL